MLNFDVKLDVPMIMMTDVQADHERVGEFISFLEKYKAISKLQLNQFLISRLHRANLIWWRFKKKKYHQNDAVIRVSQKNTFSNK